MHRPHAGYDRRDHRPGEFVNDLAKGRVLLRRTADDGERPDRPRPVVHLAHAEDGEVVLEAVVPEVVAERALRLGEVRLDLAADAEVALGRDRGPAGLRDDKA